MFEVIQSYLYDCMKKEYLYFLNFVSLSHIPLYSAIILASNNLSIVTNFYFLYQRILLE